jgi:drug/metabolite transporter (DMT)-like permease
MAITAALLGMGANIVPAPAFAMAGVPVAIGLCLAFMASNLALQYGAARLAASTTALVMLTELLFASLSSAWLGAAEFTTRTLIGGALIVLAAMLAALAPASAKSDLSRLP